MSDTCVVYIAEIRNWHTETEMRVFRDREDAIRYLDQRYQGIYYMDLLTLGDADEYEPHRERLRKQFGGKLIDLLLSTQSFYDTAWNTEQAIEFKRQSSNEFQNELRKKGRVEVEGTETEFVVGEYKLY